MKEFELYICCDNDAFEPDPAIEVARILRDLADSLEDGMSINGNILFDYNGNSVGHTSYEEN